MPIAKLPSPPATKNSLDAPTNTTNNVDYLNIPSNLEATISQPRPSTSTADYNITTPITNPDNNIETIAVPSDEDEYIVEKIVKKKTVKGQLQYLIKWAGYPDEDNTWEPVENLQCPLLIQKFNEELEEKRKTNLAKRKENKTKEQQIVGDSNLSQLPVASYAKDSNIKFLNEETDSDDDHVPKDSEMNTTGKIGFARGLKMKEILASHYKEDTTHSFIVSWNGCNELDLVDAIEMLDKEPKILANWFLTQVFLDHSISNQKSVNET